MIARRPLTERLLHRHLDRGLVVVGQVDRVDHADALARDQHLVAGHELAAGLEEQPVLVAPAAAEQQHDDDREGDQDRRHRGDPSRGRSAPLAVGHSGKATPAP